MRIILGKKSVQVPIKNNYSYNKYATAGKLARELIHEVRKRPKVRLRHTQLVDSCDCHFHNNKLLRSVDWRRNETERVKHLIAAVKHGNGSIVML